MSHHTLLHRAIHPLVAGLSRTSMTPDVLTTLRLGSGLAAAGCLAVGRGPAMAAGATVFLVSMLLDRADGALARSTGRYSRIGPLFDLVADCVSTMALFIGLGVGIGARPGGISIADGLALGLVASVSVAATFLQLNRPQQARDPDIARPFDPDDAMLLVPLAIWAGHAPWVLFSAAAITPVAALTLLGLGLAKRRRPSGQSRPSRSFSSANTPSASTVLSTSALAGSPLTPHQSTTDIPSVSGLSVSNRTLTDRPS